MSSFGDDWFKRFKERKGFFFPELDKMIEEIEKEMAKSFREMENVMPRDMVRIRRLPDGSPTAPSGGSTAPSSTATP